MASVAPAGWRQDQAFFTRMAAGLTLFTAFAFIQFTLRGFVDVSAVPWWVHLHAVVFGGWMVLFVVQNLLAGSGNLALHRQLGWLGCALAAAMVPLGMVTGIQAIVLGRQPPFFTPSYFLALTNIGMLCFGALFAWAVALRRDTEWHRRLMLAVAIMLLEPALGRVLPIPLIQPWGQAAEIAAQMAIFAIAFGHDRRFRGSVHPALWAGAAVVLLTHAAIRGVSLLPSWEAMALRLAAG